MASEARYTPRNREAMLGLTHPVDRELVGRAIELGSGEDALSPADIELLHEADVFETLVPEERERIDGLWKHLEVPEAQTEGAPYPLMQQQPVQETSCRTPPVDTLKQFDIDGFPEELRAACARAAFIARKVSSDTITLEEIRTAEAHPRLTPTDKSLLLKARRFIVSLRPTPEMKPILQVPSTMPQRSPVSYPGSLELFLESRHRVTHEVQMNKGRATSGELKITVLNDLIIKVPEGERVVVNAKTVLAEGEHALRAGNRKFSLERWRGADRLESHDVAFEGYSFSRDDGPRISTFQGYELQEQGDPLERELVEVVATSMTGEVNGKLVYEYGFGLEPTSDPVPEFTTVSLPPPQLPVGSYLVAPDCHVDVYEGGILQARFRDEPPQMLHWRGAQGSQVTSFIIPSTPDGHTGSQVFVKETGEVELDSARDGRVTPGAAISLENRVN